MSLTKKDALQKNTLTNQVDANITNLTTANLTSAKAVVRDISVTGSITIPDSSIPASAIIGGIVTTTATNDIDVINAGDDMYLGKSSQNIYIGNVDQSSDYATNSENDIGTHFQNIAYFDNHIQTTYDSTFLIDTTLDFKFRKPGTERAFFRLYDSTGEAIFSVSDANKPAQTYFKNTLHLTNGAIVDGGKLTTANIIGVITAVSPLINFNESVVSGMNSLTITNNLTASKLIINGTTASTFTTMPTVGTNPLITAATVAANYVSSSTLTTTLSNYVLSSVLNTALSNYVLSSALTTTLSNYVNLTTTQTIGGDKTFSNPAIFSQNVNVSGWLIANTMYNYGDMQVTNQAGYALYLNNLKASGDLVINALSPSSNVKIDNGNLTLLNGGLIVSSISAAGGSINFQGNELSNVGKINGLDKSKIGYLSDVTSNIQSQINSVSAAIPLAVGAATTGIVFGYTEADIVVLATAEASIAAASTSTLTSAKSYTDEKVDDAKAYANFKAGAVQTNLNNVIDQHCAHTNTSPVATLENLILEKTYTYGFMNFAAGMNYTSCDVWFGSSENTWNTRISGSNGTIVTKNFKIGTQILESMSLLSSPSYPLTIDENGNINTKGSINTDTIIVENSIIVFDPVSFTNKFTVDKYGNTLVKDLTANNITSTGNFETQNILANGTIASKSQVTANTFGIFNTTTSSYPCFIDNTGFIKGENGINIAYDRGGDYGRANVISNIGNTIVIGAEDSHIVFLGNVDFTYAKLDKSYNALKSLVFRAL